jgi:hypothetical protein
MYTRIQRNNMFICTMQKWTITCDDSWQDGGGDIHEHLESIWLCAQEMAVWQVPISGYLKPAATTYTAQYNLLYRVGSAQQIISVVNIYFAKMGCCNQDLGNPLGHIAVQGVIHHHAKS